MNARILLVEDDAINLELLDFLVSAAGYDTILARDGLEGVEMARRERPDLIVMDILMPRMDGYEAAREMRKDAALLETPIIAVTDLAMAGDREKIQQAGFDGYISKPIQIKQFIEKIAAYLSHQPGLDSNGNPP